MEKYYLWLIMVFGSANNVLTDLFNRFETPKSIYEAFTENTAAAGLDYAKKAATVSLESAEQLLSDLHSKGIHTITLDSEFYPRLLRNVPNSPIMLFAKGNIELLKGKLLTLAGSKNITNYTIAAETAICEKLCENYTFVSSLCEGCEQLACLTAIKCGKSCVEVLPCGLDVEYPKGSHLLRQQILLNGGCIISEFLPDVKTSNGNFHKRARIIGGISKAMIIFQAGLKSGSLNAAKYSPSLFFLPPNNIFAAEYAGAVLYTRNGASLYYGEEDLELSYLDRFSATPINVAPIKHDVKKDIDKEPAKNKKIESKTTEKAPPKGSEPSEELFESPIHFKTYNIIAKSTQPITFDEIFRNTTELDISELSEILLDLEISDMIRAVAGSRYTIKN